MRISVLPYVAADPTLLSPEPWTLEGDLLPERLATWDPAMDLRLARAITLKPREIRTASHLSEDAQLGVVGTARSDRTGIRVASPVFAVTSNADTAMINLMLDVKGDIVGGTLKLSTVLVFMRGEHVDPLGASRPGSTLWSDTQQCDLEGAAARFPVSAVDFATLPRLEPESAWTLDWQTADYTDNVLGALRLLVNSGYPGVVDAVVTGRGGREAEILRACINHDVAETLIRTALDDEEFLGESDHYPEGSVGRTISDLVRLYWDEPPTTLAARARDHPQRFEMELQSRFPPIPPTR